MTTGLSPVDVCNLALIRLGEDPIASFGDPSKAAILCKALYDPVRREMLRATGAWNFAKQFAYLAPSATPPPFKWALQYPLPTGFIRMWEDPVDDMPAYEIGNGLLFSNDGPPFPCIYVYDHTSVPSMDAAFIDALADRLAQRLAYPLTQSLDIAQAMRSQATDSLSAARLANAQENTAEELDDDVWLRSRFR